MVEQYVNCKDVYKTQKFIKTLNLDEFIEKYVEISKHSFTVASSAYFAIFPNLAERAIKTPARNKATEIAAVINMFFRIRYIFLYISCFI